MRLWIGAGETTVQGPRCVAMGNTSHGIAITLAMHTTHFTITAVSSLAPPPPLSLHRGGDAPLGSLLPEVAAMKRWLGGYGPFLMVGGKRKLEAFQDSGRRVGSFRTNFVCVAPRIWTRSQPCYCCWGPYVPTKRPGPGPGRRVRTYPGEGGRV